MIADRGHVDCARDEVHISRAPRSEPLDSTTSVSMEHAHGSRDAEWFDHTASANSGMRFPCCAAVTVIEDIGQHYDVRQQLGGGSVATVHAGRNRLTHQMHALKVMDKTQWGDSMTEQFVLSEIRVLHMLSHPNVVRCGEVFESKDELIISMELLTGMELFGAIQVEPEGFTEMRAATILRDILRGVEYLHSFRCVHRDLNPSNIMFADVSQTVVKLADFGFASILENEDDLVNNCCGTLHFMAPEIIQTALGRLPGYGVQCDMWSVACVLYCLLCGYEPFYQEPPEIYRVILEAQ